MRLAVLSDIHSNFTALEACLADRRIQSTDGLIFLGDYVTDCPYPQRTTAIMRRLIKEVPCWLLRGNREDYLLDYERSGAQGWSYGSNRGSLLYTYENLTKEDLDFYRQLPTSAILFLQGTTPLTLVHGSPAATRELLLPGRENSRAALSDCATTELLCGHSHKQFVFRQNGKQLINPGSVGLSISDTPGAHFTILDFHDGVWHPELYHIAYDLDSLLHAFEESGLLNKARIWSECIIASLRSGKDLAPSCARLARKLANPTQQGNGPEYIPEHFWLEAAHQLGVM